MPTYEYLCQACSYKFEVKQSIKDDPVTTCSHCGRSVKRIISAPAIMFKGSGWYVTDYSDKMKPPAAESSETTSSSKKDSTVDAGATPATPAAEKITTPSPSPASSPSSGNSSSST